MKSTPSHFAPYTYLGVFCLVLVVILSFLNVAYPHPSQAQASTLNMVLPVLALGFIGSFLWGKYGLSKQANGSQIFKLILLGCGIGALMVVLDMTFHLSVKLSETMGVKSLHVGFPYSVAVYSIGAIMVESIYRIIPVSILFWLFSHVIFKGKKPELVFWILAVPTALLEPLSQLAVFPNDPALLYGLGAFIFMVNLVLAYVFKKYGVLAVVAVRWSIYLVWHMTVGPLLVYA
jgi:hypothetical protein